MRRILAAFFAAFAMLAAPAAAEVDDGKVYLFADDDPAMNGAIAEARGYLDQVLSAFDDAPEQQHGAFMLKVGLRNRHDGVEHIWVDQLQRIDDDHWQGALANPPDDLGDDMALGSTVEFEATQISDWSIDAGHGLLGNFTTRVMLPRLPADEQREVRAMLAPEPVPEAWK